MFNFLKNKEIESIKDNMQSIDNKIDDLKKESNNQKSIGDLNELIECITIYYSSTGTDTDGEEWKKFSSHHSTSSVPQEIDSLIKEVFKQELKKFKND